MSLARYLAVTLDGTIMGYAVEYGRNDEVKVARTLTLRTPELVSSCASAVCSQRGARLTSPETSLSVSPSGLSSEQMSQEDSMSVGRLRRGSSTSVAAAEKAAESRGEKQRWLSPSEAAAFLGTAPETLVSQVSNLSCADGLFPPPQTPPSDRTGRLSLSTSQRSSVLSPKSCSASVTCPFCQEKHSPTTPKHQRGQLARSLADPERWLSARAVRSRRNAHKATEEQDDAELATAEESPNTWLWRRGVAELGNSTATGAAAVEAAEAKTTTSTATEWMSYQQLKVWLGKNCCAHHRVLFSERTEELQMTLNMQTGRLVTDAAEAETESMQVSAERDSREDAGADTARNSDQPSCLMSLVVSKEVCTIDLRRCLPQTSFVLTSSVLQSAALLDTTEGSLSNTSSSSGNSSSGTTRSGSVQEESEDDSTSAADSTTSSSSLSLISTLDSDGPPDERLSEVSSMESIVSDADLFVRHKSGLCLDVVWSVDGNIRFVQRQGIPTRLKPAQCVHHVCLPGSTPLVALLQVNGPESEAPGLVRMIPASNFQDTDSGAACCPPPHARFSLLRRPHNAAVLLRELPVLSPRATSQPQRKSAPGSDDRVKNNSSHSSHESASSSVSQRRTVMTVEAQRGAVNSFFDENFVPYRLLGKGYSGAALLVKHRLTGLFYAVKVVLARTYEEEHDILQEVRVHAGLDSRHVVRYQSAWSEVVTPQRASQLALLGLCSRREARLRAVAKPSSRSGHHKHRSSRGVRLPQSSASRGNLSAITDSGDSDMSSPMASRVSSRGTLQAGRLAWGSLQLGTGSGNDLMMGVDDDDDDDDNMTPTSPESSMGSLSSSASSEANDFDFQDRQSGTKQLDRVPSVIGARVVFLQMELCQMTLAENLAKRHVIDRIENMVIALQIISGLRYLHRRGIIHRDVKPTNVFVDYRCQLLPLGEADSDNDDEEAFFARYGLERRQDVRRCEDGCYTDTHSKSVVGCHSNRCAPRSAAAAASCTTICKRNPYADTFLRAMTAQHVSGHTSEPDQSGTRQSGDTPDDVDTEASTSVQRRDTDDLLALNSLDSPRAGGNPFANVAHKSSTAMLAAYMDEIYCAYQQRPDQRPSRQHGAEEVDSEKDAAEKKEHQTPTNSSVRTPGCPLPTVPDSDTCAAPLFSTAVEPDQTLQDDFLDFLTRWLHRHLVHTRLSDFGIAKNIEEDGVSTSQPRLHAPAILSPPHSSPHDGGGAAHAKDEEAEEEVESAPAQTASQPEHTEGVGSPLYASPEQMAGKACSPDTDGYSLGVVLAEMYMQPTTAAERLTLLQRTRDGLFPTPEAIEAFPELAAVAALTARIPTHRCSLKKAANIISTSLKECLREHIQAALLNGPWC